LRQLVQRAFDRQVGAVFQNLGADRDQGRARIEILAQDARAGDLHFLRDLHFLQNLFALRRRLRFLRQRDRHRAIQRRRAEDRGNGSPDNAV
jgi:hypothetical protein